MNTKKGFTLVEMLVVMVILSIVMVIVGSFIAEQSTTLRKQQMVANTQQNLRAAGELVTRDLQMACLNPLRVSGDTFAFKVFQANRVEFTMDLDANGVVNPRIDTLPKRDEYRGFFLNGDALIRLRGRGAPLINDTIATGIYNLAFTFYDKDGNVIAPMGQPDNGSIARVSFLIGARSAQTYRDTTHIRRTTGSLVLVRNRAF